MSEERQNTQAIVESTSRGYMVLARGWHLDGSPRHFVPIANFGGWLKDAMNFRDDIRRGVVKTILLTRRSLQGGHPNIKYRYLADENGEMQLEYAHKHKEIKFTPDGDELNEEEEDGEYGY